MVPKAVNMRSCALLVAMALLSAMLAPAQVALPKQTPPSPFDAQTASRLLLQLSEALQGHSQKQFLALFDLSRMKDGALFRQQINSFFAQTESIRAHLNLSDSYMDGEKASIAVDAEMEAEPSNGGAPSRRNERLNFVVTNAGGSWKFADLQPRSFFSLP
jgi:hypothetical protein